MLSEDTRKDYKLLGSRGFLALVLAAIGLMFLSSCMSTQYNAAPEVAGETQIPVKKTSFSQELVATPTIPPLPSQPVEQVEPPPPRIPEQRTLIVEWPPKIRVGDSALVIVTLAVSENGKLTPTVEIEGDEMHFEPLEIPNLYDTHRIIAQARFDIAGLRISPSGEFSEQLLPGKPISFSWSVRPMEAGEYRGTIWLHLVFVPLDGGAESRIVLSTQRIDISAVNLFGLSGKTARIFGGIGSIVGSFLGLDSLLSWFLKFLGGRFKRPK